VWLEVTPPEAARRLAAAPLTRPLLAGADPEARLRAVLDQRTPLYGEIAERRVVTDGLGVDAVADRVLAELDGDRQ
jgi:shikimate kinase